MSDIFIVRQPVFDRSNTAVGYELRFREPSDGSDAFARSYLSGAFDELRSGLPAYVRCTPRHLAERIFESADSRALIVLLPPELEPDTTTIEAVRALQAAGIIVAVDEYDEGTHVPAGVAALSEIAPAARIDLRAHDSAWVSELARRLRARGKRLIADHVLDAQSHKLCLDAEFERFQGPYFSRPEPIPTAELPSSTATALRVLALARDVDTPERELERALSVDPGLTFQLLRLVNNASTGMRGVESISHALRLVGRNAFVRWLALAFATTQRGNTGADAALVQQAVQRARLCELVGRTAGHRDAGSLFLMGLFSMLDAVFRMPLHEILDRVRLSPEVHAALLDRAGPFAGVLELVESYELGLWEGAAENAARLGVRYEVIPEMYSESLAWAEQQTLTA